ncbi:MAG: DUF1080 domain-containing protein [Planctomycetota bacterium]
MTTRLVFHYLISVVLLLMVGLQVTVASADESANEATKVKATKQGWQPMVKHWRAVDFGGDGPVTIEPTLLTLGYGDPMTGIRWNQPFPKQNFEVRMEARRTDGNDFFCGLTFPVGDGSCSLILGGWGGGVVGLSSIDGADASENPTSDYKQFHNDQWYKIRVRVDHQQIQCWVDEKSIVKQERGDHEFEVRFEMDPTLPIGLANYQCESEFRKLEFRRIPEGEIKAK